MDYERDHETMNFIKDFANSKNTGLITLEDWGVDDKHIGYAELFQLMCKRFIEKGGVNAEVIMELFGNEFWEIAETLAYLKRREDYKRDMENM